MLKYQNIDSVNINRLNLLLIRGLKIVFFLMPAIGLAQIPSPGDIYKEYSRTMGQTNKNWRVTGEEVKRPDAREFLPNDILQLEINDLQGAVKAEAIIDRWGGHTGTLNKKIRFNNNEWISLPELTTTPAGEKPESYCYQDNPVVPIPLAYLHEGVNTFEGACNTPGHFWPQWGWVGIIIRVYYNASKPHPTGRIISPVVGDILTENPLIIAEAKSKTGIERIDILAYYNGYDENGDGIYKDWHCQYWCLRNAEKIDISGHVGTIRQVPYEVKWNATLIPDQEKDSIKLVARIKGKDGTWYVTDVIDGLTLKREDYSVQMYTASDVPPEFSVRNYSAKSCKIRISPEADLQNAVEAWFCLRTWNGFAAFHEPFLINNWPDVFQGNNHNFDMDVTPIHLMAIRPGDNIISYYSKTIDHMAEILWPGPAFIIRYQNK